MREKSPLENRAIDRGVRIEYAGRRDKIIIPAIPGGRDGVPSGTWKDPVGGERGESVEPGTRHM